MKRSEAKRLKEKEEGGHPARLGWSMSWQTGGETYDCQCECKRKCWAWEMSTDCKTQMLVGTIEFGPHYRKGVVQCLSKQEVSRTISWQILPRLRRVYMTALASSTYIAGAGTTNGF